MIAALAAAAAVAAPGHVVGVRPVEGLHRLGPMRLAEKAQESPPYQPRWTLAYALEAFGAAASTRPADRGCEARWPDLGLTLHFTHVHQPWMGPDTVCRNPALSHLRGARITGRGFVTSRGISVRTPLSVVRRRYPSARRSGRRWALVRTRVFGRVTTTLSVTVRDGRVSSVIARNTAD